MSLKAQFRRDRDIFLNLKGFGEMVDWNGEQVKANLQEERSEDSIGRGRTSHPGVHMIRLVVRMKTEAIDRPKPKSKIKLNGKDYYVIAAEDQHGMLKVILERKSQ